MISFMYFGIGILCLAVAGTFILGITEEIRTFIRNRKQ